MIVKYDWQKKTERTKGMSTLQLLEQAVQNNRQVTLSVGRARNLVIIITELKKMYGKQLDLEAIDTPLKKVKK
jgi:hypothetical protein